MTVGKIDTVYAWKCKHSDRIVDFSDDSREHAHKIDDKKIEAILKLIHEITVILETVGYDPITYKEKAMDLSCLGAVINPFINPRLVSQMFLITQLLSVIVSPLSLR